MQKIIDYIKSHTCDVLIPEHCNKVIIASGVDTKVIKLSKKEIEQLTKELDKQGIEYEYCGDDSNECEKCLLMDVCYKKVGE